MDLDICQKSGSPSLFKLLGFSIAHSFLQNGPSFPNLANWIFEALVQSNEDVVCSQLSVNYIPLNAATSVLKLFQRKLTMHIQMKSLIHYSDQRKVQLLNKL